MSTPFHPFALDRRYRLVRLVVLLVFAVLIVAFFRTQILGYSRYRLQSETNRLKEIVLPAPRGLILDRNGKVLADNIPGYTISLLPDDTAKLHSRLRQIAPFADLDSEAIARVLERFLRAPYQPALVMAN
ncbi:MAG TPA: hypothetical protein VI159_08400, partial [Gemmatimonadales bacterium]